MTTIVFLHIPKTAGQTIHAEIERVIGSTETSPVRVHTQAAPSDQFPPGYQFYSGHLDWVTLGAPDPSRFTFSVLRDPRERIASFYFYLLEKAHALDDAALAAPQRSGMRMIKTLSADDYFFGGNTAWKLFIRDHYDNFYCSYFATKKMRGWADVSKLSKNDLIRRAIAGSQKINAIYTLDSLSQLEQDLLPILGATVRLADNLHNVGPQPEGTKRWPKLRARLERDESITTLEEFTALDIDLMDQIDLR